MHIRATVLTAVAMALMLGASAAAASGKASVNSQKAADCNTQAAGLTDSQREAFMRTCLGGGAAPKAAPQDARANCQGQANAQGLRGDERRTFMTQCMQSGDN